MGVSIHHIDLPVSDVERSLAFYLGLLDPFGRKEAGRFPHYEMFVFDPAGMRIEVATARPSSIHFGKSLTTAKGLFHKDWMLDSAKRRT